MAGPQNRWSFLSVDLCGWLFFKVGATRGDGSVGENITEMSSVSQIFL